MASVGMNWRATYISAQLAETAYSETLAGAVLAYQALGYAVIGHYLNDSHQAFALHNGDGHTLAISGTRFGRAIGDLLDDVDIVGVGLGDGSRVARGPYSGMDDMWVWAHSLAPVDATWSVVGHSLGGERALMTELFVPFERIRSLFAFEAPKCGNDAFWARLAKSMTRTVSVINGQDLWAGWPMVSGWSHPPIAHIHLLDTGWEIVGHGSWPAALSHDDHSIAMVVDRLKKIADAMSA